MRDIHLDDGFTLRFPGRDEEFAAGVEIGMLAVLMDMGQVAISRWIATENIAQARALALKLGYRMAQGADDGGWTRVTLHQGRARPRLEIVHSA